MPIMPVVVLIVRGALFLGGSYLVKRSVLGRVRSAEQAVAMARRKAQRAILMSLAAVVVSSVLTSLVVWSRTSGNAGEPEVVQERTTLGEEEEGAGSRDGSTPVIEDRGSRDAAFP